MGLSPPARILLGPGPSQVPPDVLAALALPTVGHLDPFFLEVLDRTQALLRRVFETENQLTLPMSGTGSAGMETLFVNLLEPGDRVLVGVNGVFGGRMCEVARRCGAQVDTVEAPWGRAIDPDDIRHALAAKRYAALAVVHAETSTGVLQDLAALRALADGADALLFVDMVTSLGGVRTRLDAHGIDAAYSGTQKCLSCPPGLAPISLSERAQRKLQSRKTAVQSWYLDLSLIGNYWGERRTYHHTAPINMIYALHEALHLVVEEGLQARCARHARHARALWAGLQAMGLTLPVPEQERLAPLTLVQIPSGVEDKRVRKRLLLEHGIEIGGGLGAFAGKAWRIGLMGASSTSDNFTGCLQALGEALAAEGYQPPESGADAARAALGAAV